MAKRLPVLIAGGGIGGLSTAIALGRADFETSVLERSAFTEESGAGIQLGPNATRILRALGVLDLLMPQAFRPEAVWVFDGLTGRKLATVPLGDRAEQRYGAPYLTFHRADLHAGLREAAEAGSTVSLSSGFDVARIEDTHRDGATGKITVTDSEGSTLRGSALVGADGLWSTVRKWIAPDASLSFTGATAFRTLLPLSDVPAPFTAPIVGLWLGPNAHLVHYPVRAGEALNVVAVTETGQRGEGWNQEADRSALLAAFTRWCSDSKSLLERGDKWRAWSLFSLNAVPHWSRGAVTLLGDAAHPVLPYLAQGAGLAIEDAATLAQGMRSSRDNPAAAFEAFEAARRPRARRLQQTAQRFGRAYHMGGPFRLVRNTALALRSKRDALRRFDWLYGQEV